MLEHRIIPDTNIIEFFIDGDVTKDDMESALLACDLFIKEHDKIRILKRVDRIGSMDPGMVWENMKWGWRNISHITHVAAVADKKWAEIWTKMANPFVSAELRFFSTDELEKAQEWLRTAG